MILEYRTRPPAGEPDGALVLFHGRGADANDLFPLLDMLDPDERLLGLTPQGPLMLPPGGYHWYIVREVGSPDPATFVESFNAASEWLDSVGVPPERTVLGGFSQGAVMSYALGLAGERPRPAAIVALSGFIPAVESFDLDLERPLPPIAIGHGTLDPVIEVEWGRKAKQTLVAAGADVLYREYPLPHVIDPRFIGELVPWIRSALAQSVTGAR